MVAALFEGDLNYGVTVFGKPRSLEAVTVPNNYPLPNDVINCVDVDFVFYPGAELFRVFRFGASSSNLVLFSIQTHAFSLNSGRPKTFIGAGIFARAGVDPEALVSALRDLLKGAQKALLKDGKFIVDGIGAYEKRLLTIPESVDKVRSPRATWLATHSAQISKHIFIEPTNNGVSTPEQFFERVLSFPQAFSSNTFFSQDERVINDCRVRSDEFDVMNSTAVFEHASRFFSEIHTKHALMASELKTKKQEIAELRKNQKQTVTALTVERNAQLSREINPHYLDVAQRNDRRSMPHRGNTATPAWLPYVKTLAIVILIFCFFLMAYFIVNQLVRGNS